jgi:hypothetical protein
MNKQPTKPVTTWEMLTEKLLSIYAKSLQQMESPVEPMERAQLRADVRLEIIAIGKLLDDTEKQHSTLLEKVEKINEASND